MKVITYFRLRNKSNNLKSNNMENQEKNNANATAVKPAYLMVQVHFKNLEESIQRYGQFAIPSLKDFGGEMIAGTATPTIKEGDWAGNWAAVLRFPSVEAAENWYQSDVYKPLKAMRINELEAEAGRVLLLEGM